MSSIAGRRKARVRWVVVLLCGLGALAAILVAGGQGVRYLRESLAIAALSSEDPEELEAALRELGQMRSLRAVPHILAAMEPPDEAPDGEWDALNLYPRCGTSMMETEPTWDEKCLDVVASMGEPALPVLRSRLLSPVPTDRLRAVRLISTIGENDPVEHAREIMPLLGDTHLGVSRQAALAVGKAAARDPSILERIARDLTAEESGSGLRLACSEALAFAGMEVAWAEAEDAEAPHGPAPPAFSTVVRALTASLTDESARVRLTSVMALGALRDSFLGVLSDPAFLSMEEALRSASRSPDAEIRLAAVVGLQDETPSLPTLEVFARGLSDPDPSIQQVASSYLGTPAAVPLLIPELKKEEATVRVLAAGVLSSIGPGARDAWPSLLELLGDAREEVREAAADALGEIGGELGLGVPLLCEALASSDSRIRKGAAKVLRHYEWKGSEAAESLALRLGDEKPDVREEALLALISVGGLTTEALPIFIAVLKSSDPERCRRAIDVLVATGGEDAWPAVFELLASPDESIRRAAVEGLSFLGENDGLGIDRLVRALASKDPVVRKSATAVLGRYHAKGSFDPQDLLPLVDHEDEEVRAQAVEALSWSGKLYDEVFERKVLVLLAGARTDSLRRAACRAVADLEAVAAEKAVPSLISLLEAESWDGKVCAVEALGVIGPAAEPAIPALRAVMSGADVALAVQAIEALGSVGTRDALAAVIPGLFHPDESVRDAALTALWSLGPGAALALPALKELVMVEKVPELKARAAALATRLAARASAAESR